MLLSLLANVKWANVPVSIFPDFQKFMWQLLYILLKCDQRRYLLASWSFWSIAYTILSRAVWCTLTSGTPYCIPVWSFSAQSSLQAFILQSRLLTNLKKGVFLKLFGKGRNGWSSVICPFSKMFSASFKCRCGNLTSRFTWQSRDLTDPHEIFFKTS